MTNKRGLPEVDRALRLEGRSGMVDRGDAKHEQASSLSHGGIAPPPRRAKRKEKNDSDESPPSTPFDKSNAREIGDFSSMLICGMSLGRQEPRRARLWEKNRS